jgi:hypothetical protein
MLAVVVTTASAAYANAQQFQATLSGFNEIGGLGAGETGAILTNGRGTRTVKRQAQLQRTEHYAGCPTPVIGQGSI